MGLYRYGWLMDVHDMCIYVVLDKYNIFYGVSGGRHECPRPPLNIGFLYHQFSSRKLYQ